MPTDTILLVEDIAPLREMPSEMLQGAGYSVIAAKNALEAIRIVQQDAGKSTFC